jgi:hypothetical protein
MQLRPIEEPQEPAALALLAEGFPARGADEWTRILRRAAQFRDPQSAWPLGYVLMVKDEEAGVVITTASTRRRPDGTRFDMVNLSGWYVRANRRLMALPMLKSILARDDAVFTDITPIPAVQRLNEMLGFRLENEAVRLYPMPFSALSRHRGAHVTDATAPDVPVDPEAARILADHAALGCVTGLLHLPDRVAPLIFAFTDRRGLPGLRLIYGPDKATVAAHAGSISRFLARRPILFWEINANRSDRLPGSVFWRRAAPCQLRGNRPDDAIDYAYSEVVFSQRDAAGKPS